MNATINAKELRASLPELVRRVRRGARFTVLYRSRPAFQIVPVSESDQQSTPLETDSLYRARAVGSSTDSLTAADHDTILYGR
jgi:prevent-host-death family protein